MSRNIIMYYIRSPRRCIRQVLWLLLAASLLSTFVILLKTKTDAENHRFCQNIQRNLCFIKVHKAASTTVQNIFQRYAYQHGLSVALPDNYPETELKLSSHGTFPDLIQPPPNGTFNMLLSHLVPYDRHLIAKILPSDTKYVGIVREPLSLTMSALEFFAYGPWKLYGDLPQTNKLKAYMSNREKYEPRNRVYSYTNNRMAFDFGVPMKQFRNKTFITNYIAELDSYVDLVMVAERFVESVVLLRRILCWEVKDVLYLPRVVNSKRLNMTFTSKELQYHRNFSIADHMFYDHFVQKFEKLVEKQNPDFFKEVKMLASIQREVESYCRAREKVQYEPGTKLVVNPKPFGKSFTVRTEDCQLLLMTELEFLQLSLKKQRQFIVSGGDIRP